MARTQLSALVRMLRGNIDGLVFKTYGKKVVVTRRPDMSKVKPSEAQQAHRARFQTAGYFAAGAMADEALCGAYAAEARRRKLSIRAVAIRDFFSAPEIAAMTIKRVGRKHVVRLRGTDDFEINVIALVVTTTDGQIVEQGMAQRTAGGWRYPATGAWPPGERLKITATATDRAGNCRERSLEWSDDVRSGMT